MKPALATGSIGSNLTTLPWSAYQLNKMLEKGQPTYTVLKTEARGQDANAFGVGADHP